MADLTWVGIFGLSNPGEERNMKEDEFIVTPWKVEGKVDYNKLVEKFGTELIDDELLERFVRDAGESNHLFCC